MDDPKKRALVVGGAALAAVVALLSIVLAWRRSTATPYEGLSPEKARAARERVRERERTGPPGGAAPAR